MEAHRAGLDEFFDVIKDVRRVALFCAGGLILLPVAASLGGYAPPWPKGITTITTLMEMAVVITAFQLSAGKPRRVASRRVVLSLCAMVFFSLIYLGLNAVFVVTIPNSDVQIVLGCGLSRSALLVQRLPADLPLLDACPGEFASLLASAQYETDKIYTRLSVSAIRVCLVIAWLGAFASFASLTGVFVTFQRRARKRS
jgi:hypothetical protein